MLLAHAKWIQQGYECQLKLRRLKIELSCNFLFYFKKFRIDKIFSTTDLRELYIPGSCDFDQLFSSSDIDPLFPKLIQLGLRQVYFYENAPAKICTFRHKSLRKIIVSTMKAGTYIAQLVCQLTVQFPNPSIHWWKSLPMGPVGFFLLEQQSSFSPQIEPGCVGFHWFAQASRSRVTLYHVLEKLKFKVATSYFGKKKLVTLKRCYTERELRSMLPLYYGKIYFLERFEALHCRYGS